MTLANLCALAIVIALSAYVVMAGADFGGGVWDILASGPRKHEQRKLVAHAIGPIWEANHVWLILVVVLLFMCFPPAFSAIMTSLNIPLTLMLVGIVLRGSAFAFRAYDVKPKDAERLWGRTFAIASVFTPVLLGDCIGAIASGALASKSPDAGTWATYVAPWLAPFPIACGVLTLATFTFLAATYLTLDADSDELREDFRRRALWSAGIVFLSAFGTLAIANTTQSPVATLMHSPWALPFHVATGAAALGAIVALWIRQFHLARIAAAGQVLLILWGWVASQYPSMIPGQLSIAEAAAPDTTLRLALYALAGGAVILIPSLWYLFRVFKGSGARP